MPVHLHEANYLTVHEFYLISFPFTYGSQEKPQSLVLDFNLLSVSYTIYFTRSDLQIILSESLAFCPILEKHNVFHYFGKVARGARSL